METVQDVGNAAEIALAVSEMGGWDAMSFDGTVIGSAGDSRAVMTRDEYRAAYDSAAEDLRLSRLAYSLAVETMESGDKDEIIRFGKNLALMIDGSLSYSNSLAAILEEFREFYRLKYSTARAVETRKAETRKAETRELPYGTFTVVFNDDEDDYRTILIEKLEHGKLAGKTIASYLSGSDNETSFTGFAFVNADGSFKIWKRLEKLAGTKIETALRVVLKLDDEGLMDAREAYALKSGRCSRCSRKLTVPSSLHRGLGPECASILGVA